jgi:predicted O-methyltransferase YrrM
VDVRKDVGVLVAGSGLEDGWTKVIIESELPGVEDLRQRLRPFMPFDVFFHDSDHRFFGQMLDYIVAKEGLASDGLLISDDIDVTGAWLDAAQRGFLPSDRITLIDHRKAIGFAMSR